MNIAYIILCLYFTWGKFLKFLNDSFLSDSIPEMMSKVSLFDHQCFALVAFSGDKDNLKSWQVV